MKQNMNKLKEAAMRFGTIMGLFWIFKLTFFVFGLNNSLFGFIFISLTLMVPFLGFAFTKRYRNSICGGYITFSHAFAFSVMMYFFAALLCAVGHYIYFRFLDNGFLIGEYSKLVSDIKDLKINETEDLTDQMNLILDTISSLTPIKITIQLLSQNIFYSTIISAITAIFVAKRNANQPQ